MEKINIKLQNHELFFIRTLIGNLSASDLKEIISKMAISHETKTKMISLLDNKNFNYDLWETLNSYQENPIDNFWETQ